MQLYEALLAQHRYTWLVTGAAGFIGSHLTEALLKYNQRVIGIDNFYTGRQANLDQVLAKVSAEQASQFEFVEMDICHEADCKRVTSGVDYVLHHAAFASVPDSINQPSLANTVNVQGFLNMLCAARDGKVKRFIYASSSSVYGNLETLPIKESYVGLPLSPYAVSKYANELYALTFANCYSLETIGLRYFNVFGPRQDPNGAYAAVIPLWMSALLNQRPVYIYGDGQTSRDFCYVSNVVQANLLAALTTNQQAVNAVYNIASGHEITLNALYGMMCETLSLQGKQPVYSNFRAGDIRRSWACVEKAKVSLGYVPSDTLKHGLAECVAWV